MKLAEEKKLLEENKKKHKQYGSDKEKHMSHEYRQIKESAKVVKSHKVKYTLMKGEERKIISAYNTIRSQNNKRKKQIRQKEEMIETE